MEYLIAIGFTILLTVVGFVFGTINEKKHYASILEREEKLLNLPTLTVSAKSLSQDLDLNQFSQVRLVSGGTVLSIDYFKRFLGILRMFFGGNISAYESLIDRARREAILRLKEQAGNADLIINLKLETSDVGSGSGKKNDSSVTCIETFAYATALYK
ncbi:MAG: heavy metal-binding domain-containing protein [Candidatus Caenarcaniphilales bacterium]|nr:heavy metal-binding domain-containing protein [Candidatus Caenarcaniphilales bacterium]